mgnify:CR=1 FL=1
MPIFSPAAAVLSVGFVTSVVSGTNATTSLTFSSVSFGAAAADRQIVVLAGASMDAVATITGVTIGGVTGAALVTATSAGRNANMYIASVPSGTSGDIVISINTATGEAWGIGVYRVTGTASTTPSDTATQTSNSPEPIALTLSCPAGGAIIAGGITNDGYAGVWANATERYDEVMELSQWHSGAMTEFAAAQTDLAVTFDSGAPGQVVYVAASLVQA